MSNSQNSESKYFISKEDYQKLVKTRIIQKNLVHFQNFPDSLADENILIQQEYFGQFGKILKIVLIKRNELKSKSNSAYITFSTNEEAAYAILVMDSLIIENNLVRAFFGTSKYCIHFLNNIECYNKEKCMYVHSFANDNEILGNSKFGYDEHLKLAKKIINFGSFENRNFVMNLNINFYTIFPNIKSIYLKEDYFSELNTNYSSSFNNNTSESFSSCDSNKNVFYLRNNLNDNFGLFKYKDESRYFNKNNNYYYSNNNNFIYNNFDVSESLKNLIDDIFIRMNFFKKFDKYYPFQKVLMEFCKKKYGLINESWIDNELINHNIDANL